MSTRNEEARALDMARDFLLGLGSGRYKISTITELRDDARRISRHFPLAAGTRWRDER